MGRFHLAIVCLFLCIGNKAYSESLHKDNIHQRNNVLYFVNGFDAKLYLYSDKNSEVLTELPYGSILELNSEVEPTNKLNWFSVHTSSKLSGFILSGEVLKTTKKNLFKTISSDVLKKFSLINLKNDISAWQQITNFLFQSAESGDFTGEQYVFFRVFSGEALANAVDAMQVFETSTSIDNLDSNNFNKQIDSNDFLKSYKIYLTKDTNTNQVRLDENFFWKYASLNSNSKYAEIAGRLAMDQIAEKDCNREPICFLLSLNNREFRYLRFFPNSKSKKKLSESINSKLKKFTKEKEQIRCFLPNKDYNYQIFNQLKFNRYYLYEREVKKFDKYYSIIQDECFPVI